MAWLERRGQKFRPSFRYRGRMYRHSLGTGDQREADASLSILEEGLRLLEHGRLDPPPPGSDLALYLLSEGKVSAKPQGVPAPVPLTLSEVAAGYSAAQRTALESSSLYTLGIHLRHLQRSFGEKILVPSLTLGHLQAHVNHRAPARPAARSSCSTT